MIHTSEIHKKTQLRMNKDYWMFLWFGIMFRSSNRKIVKLIVDRVKITVYENNVNVLFTDNNDLL